MSTKKQLEEISAALNNASKMHKEQSGKLKAMAGKMKDDAKLEQRRYTKSRRNTNKLVRVKTGPTVGEKIKSALTKKEDPKPPTTNNPKEMTTNTTYGSRNESASDRYAEMTNLNQSRKVLHQVSTGQQAGVGPMGNFPVAPEYVPPMQNPMPAQPGMMNPNYPPVPQDKQMPKGKEGKGIRSLPANVQEKMGYDPLSQERNK